MRYYNVSVWAPFTEIRIITGSDIHPSHTSPVCERMCVYALHEYSISMCISPLQCYQISTVLTLKVTLFSRIVHVLIVHSETLQCFHCLGIISQHSITSLTLMLAAWNSSTDSLRVIWGFSAKG